MEISDLNCNWQFPLFEFVLIKPDILAVCLLFIAVTPVPTILVLFVATAAFGNIVLKCEAAAVLVTGITISIKFILSAGVKTPSPKPVVVAAD